MLAEEDSDKLLEEEVQDDSEEILTFNESPDETIQIQGSDRKYPAVVRRAAFTIDKSRTTIQTISRYDRKGNLNPLYDAYADDIQDYRKRRGQATRSHSEILTKTTGKLKAGLSGVGKGQERSSDLSQSGYLDPRSTFEVVLAKGKETDETFK